ncbi:MAG TPA: methyltransferase domain-containing protein, partial [Candidatus Limnocylindrales bacterium]|nr:methyltransferase domain-containing protein [Candidatus Limnocylindrales bacterium]
QNMLLQQLKARLFVASQAHYASHRWYGSYRRLELERVTACPVDPGNLPAGFGRWVDERIVEYPWFFSQLPEGPGMLLDAGSTLNHDFVLRHSKLREKKITIMTLAPEEQCYWNSGISYVYGDLRHTFFRDNTFDVVASLSVIEHIGLDNRIYDSAARGSAINPEGYAVAVAEFRRLLKPGGRCLITVPFGKPAVRNWLQIFDAAMIDRIIAAFQPASHSEVYFRYSEASGWQSVPREAAADEGYFDVHHDTPWPGCPAAAGAVACLALMK